MRLAADLITDLVQAKDFTSTLRARVAQRSGTVVLPEVDDDRVLRAAIALRELGLARPLLLGEPGPLRRRLAAQQVDPGAFEVVDPREDPRADVIADRLRERRQGRITQGEAKVLSRQPLHFGAGLVGLGQVEAMVAGATHPTSDVLRSGLYHVGLAEGIDVVSGSFLMIPPPGHAIDRPLLFADAAVVPVPTASQLRSIGVASARTYRTLVEGEPRVACLSFSTKGSADHESARHMAAVAEALRAAGLDADGELQFDAALVPEVAASKAPGSPLSGSADLLLFPDLNAANIGYKIAQRLGGFAAVGPLIQGLARPVFDLSRGCHDTAVVDTAVIALLSGGGEAG